MPPGGVHLTAGVGALRCFSYAYGASRLVRGKVDGALGRFCPSVEAADRRKAIAVGFILGTILPDADLLLCILIGAVTTITEKDLEVFHRTFSHSLLVIPLLALALISWLQSVEAKGTKGARGALQKWAVRLGLVRGGEEPRTSVPQVLVLFVTSVALGCALHCVMDLFYVMKLQILWPLSYQFDVPLIYPLEFLSEKGKKLLIILDFGSDMAFWYLPLLVICGKTGIQGDKVSFLACVIASYVLTLGFFMRESWIGDAVSTVHFTRRLYITGTVWVTTLKLSPVIFGEAVTAVCMDPLAALEPRPQQTWQEGECMKRAALKKIIAARSKRRANFAKALLL
ncbi:hypothetical protein HOP50_06g41210 [Chloropicon primus]|uniref:Metal-dependent hydrolase n=2 Tax=Chloropicon primus TaxID=1764295 RepID=A0A5B8MNH8_9CHLO|nr:hypothetical protein A3770_06p41120 [Chloropicon primus]UPR00805.1 hypothetical protein HOP50_06g41210 [Chloropicon primus]|eukprot:QDZ21594.1 hypothetical protein A3770_06p41120 [Chloropicon primus]